MNEVKNAQYQHNGSGTALLINKDYNHLPARDMYNDHKRVTEIIINQPQSFITQTKNFVKNRGQFFRELYFRNRDRLFQEGNYFIAVSEFS